MLINEAKILSKVQHPNIVRLKTVYESKQHVFIVMEIAPAGTLKAFINMCNIQNTPPSDLDCSIIIRQILAGLEHIHALHIVHRDISPKNILMQSFKHLEGAIKIADFGLGTELNNYNQYAATERCGTVIYMAPEQLLGTDYKKVRGWGRIIGNRHLGNWADHVPPAGEQTSAIRWLRHDQDIYSEATKSGVHVFGAMESVIHFTTLQPRTRFLRTIMSD
jgi:serine/threonine protein kinase